jgi:hypothetical protein
MSTTPEAARRSLAGAARNAVQVMRIADRPEVRLLQIRRPFLHVGLADDDGGSPQPFTAASIARDRQRCARTSGLRALGAETSLTPTEPRARPRRSLRQA